MRLRRVAGRHGAWTATLRRGGFDLQAKLGDLGFEALEAFGDGLKGERDLTALKAEGLELLAGDVGLGDKAFGFALEAGESRCGLGLFVAGLADALHQLHGGAAVLLGLLLGGGDGANGLLGLRLMALGGLARAVGFGGGVLEEAAVLLKLSGEAGQLLPSLREVVGAGGEAAGEFGDAVGVGRGAGGDALEFDGGLIGLGCCLANLLVEGVAVADAFGVLGVHCLDGCGLRVDLGGESGDLFGGGGLLGVKLRHAAGEHDAKAGAELFAERAVTLGLGGLALEGGHLSGDFVEDVVDAGEILLGGFEAKFGETLFRLEAGDAGGLFDDGAAVVGLGGEKLADALLADDGVGFATEAGAHEDVLNVAETADLAVEEVLAVAGAEEAAGDGEFAGADGGAAEFAAADLQDDIVWVGDARLVGDSAASAASTGCGPLASPSMTVPGWASATASSVSAAFCWRRVVSSQSVGSLSSMTISGPPSRLAPS